MNEGWNNNENQNNNQNGYSQNQEEYAFQTLLRNGKPKTMGWSIASMVLGILSVVCCSLGYAAILFGIVAIIAAVISRRALGYFDGMSIAGLLLGIFGIVFGVAIIIMMYSLPEEFWDEFYAEFENQYGNNSNGGDL